MLRGILVLPIEPHDDVVHLAYHIEFMAAPEFLELPPEIQGLFFEHQRMHEIQQANKAIKLAAQAAIAGELQPGAASASPAGGAPAGSEPA